jgi:hypothetical protein
MNRAWSSRPNLVIGQTSDLACHSSRHAWITHACLQQWQGNYDCKTGEKKNLPALVVVGDEDFKAMLVWTTLLSSSLFLSVSLWSSFYLIFLFFLCLLALSVWYFLCFFSFVSSHPGFSVFSYAYAFISLLRGNLILISLRSWSCMGITLAPWLVGLGHQQSCHC